MATSGTAAAITAKLLEHDVKVVERAVEKSFVQQSDDERAKIRV